MKIFAFLGAMMVAFLPVLAQAEQIRSFGATLSLTRGDDVFVRETIIYDFEGAMRHGIYRDLPSAMCPGAACVSTGLEFFPPTRNGQPEPYETVSSAKSVRQRIGDPELTITDAHEYGLQYTLRRLVVEKDGKQLVSWNVTGNEWPVSIQASTLRLEGPVNPLYAECFSGPSGSRARDCEVLVRGGVVTASTTRALAPSEGWTVDVWYPAGTFAASITPAPEPPIPYWLMFVGVMTMGWALVWWFFGRDAKGRGTIIPEYNPPKELKPYEAQALLNETASARGLTATVLDFARRGLLTISTEKGFFKNRYILQLVREPKIGELDSIEQKAFSAFFSSGANEFVVGTRSEGIASAFSAWKQAVNAELKQKGWHHWHATSARALAVIIVFAMAFAGAYITSRLTVDEISPILVVIGGLFSLPFAYSMPRSTRDGTLLIEHLKGFKRYIRVAEKDRLAFHEGPQATPERFSALLPFAVALHEEEAWAKIFADIGMTDRQLSAYGVGMTTSLVSDLSRGLNSSISTSMVSPSKGSGGGGFSGGGGGGGGGGSW